MDNYMLENGLFHYIFIVLVILMPVIIFIATKMCIEDSQTTWLKQNPKLMFTVNGEYDYVFIITNAILGGAMYYVLNNYNELNAVQPSILNVFLYTMLIGLGFYSIGYIWMYNKQDTTIGSVMYGLSATYFGIMSILFALNTESRNLGYLLMPITCNLIYNSMTIWNSKQSENVLAIQKKDKE